MKTLYEETTTGTACYIYGPAGKLAKRTTISSESNTFYYHSDHLGSNRLVTDSNKNIVSAISYHPFGEPSLKEGEEHYLFTGKEKDETGVYYYGARYYDPDLGRFLTRDLLSGKLVNPQSLHRYTYCYNNPLLFVDPDGLDPEVNDVTADLTTEFWLGGTIIAAPTIIGSIIWGVGGGLLRYELEGNWNADLILDVEGNPLISIYASSDTLGIGAYFASITVEADDEGNYRGNIRNVSNTLVSVSVFHHGSGTLDLFLS